MTILEAITRVYKLYEKSVDAVDTDSEDFLVRLEYGNNSINKWEEEPGIEWSELYALLSKTLTAGVYATEAADKFARPLGYLIIGTDKYDYVRPEAVHLELLNNPSRKFFYVLGARGAKTINVNPAISGAFTVPYRKYATTFITGLEATEIEMSDPGFLVNDVLAQLYLDDDNTTEASVKNQTAQQKMEGMKLKNEIPPFWQSNAITNADTTAFGTRG